MVPRPTISTTAVSAQPPGRAQPPQLGPLRADDADLGTGPATVTGTGLILWGGGKGEPWSPWRRSSRRSGAVLHAVPGDLHEGLLQRSVAGGEFVHGQVRPPGHRPDLFGGQCRRHASGHARSAAHGHPGAASSRPSRTGPGVRTGRAAVAWATKSATLASAISLPRPITTSWVGGLRHLAHQVRGHENRTAFGGQ